MAALAVAAFRHTHSAQAPSDRPDRADDGPTGLDRKQIDAAVKLYQAKNRTTVAGKKIKVILKDNGAVPDNTKPIAQETDRQRSQFRRLRRDAGRARRRSARHRESSTDRDRGRHLDHHRALSLHRAHQLHAARSPRWSSRMGALKDNVKKVVTMVSDYAPGADAEKSFTEDFKGRRR